ncbi:Phosphatidylinositol 3-kinase, root isoform [Spatholobus suberectus]|nr:Phosphatidylinositol 3-kinase, root isoform [Spatholobus suberectus]
MVQRLILAQLFVHANLGWLQAKGCLCLLHLDNLLLRNDGHLFHVDFGFILGRDPKPFPPPMKLCKEMVEAMGGAESDLILNLFYLMAGSNIPDIASDPEKGILKSLLQWLQEKFRLDLDDEASIHFFQDLINESVSALFPQMVETIHRWAQYWW